MQMQPTIKRGQRVNPSDITWGQKYWARVSGKLVVVVADHHFDASYSYHPDQWLCRNTKTGRKLYLSPDRFIKAYHPLDNEWLNFHLDVNLCGKQFQAHNGVAGLNALSPDNTLWKDTNQEYAIILTTSDMPGLEAVEFNARRAVLIF
jgi:hypothetical protein